MSGHWKYAGLTFVLVTAFGQLIPVPVPAADQPQKGDETKKPRTDLYGDPLPEGAVARLGTLRLRHIDRVGVLVFSPDSKWLASGGPRGTALWEVQTGRLVREFQGPARHIGMGHEIPAGEVKSLAFSPNGVYLAAGTTERWDVWDVASGKRLVAEGEWKGRTLVTFCKDSKRLLVYAGEEIQVWNLSTGQKEHSFGVPANLKALSLSAEGDTIAAAAGKTVIVWTLSSGKVKCRLEESESPILELSFSSDGKTVTAINNTKTLRSWDVATGKELRSFKIKGWPLNFSPDGTGLLTAHTSGATVQLATIQLLDTTKGEQLHRFDAGYHSATNGAVSPCGKMLALAHQLAPGTIQLWDIATGKLIHDFPGHRTGVTSIVYSPKGGKLATGGDCSIRIWDLATGRQIREFGYPHEYILCVAFSPDGALIATAGSGWKIRLWDAGTGTELGQFEGHNHLVDKVAFSPDGTRLASASLDRSVRIWDVATTEELTHILEPEGHFRCVSFSPDGSSVAAAGENTPIGLWDASTGKEQRRLVGANGVVLSVAFSPDGKLLACGESSETGGRVRWWDLLTGEELRSVLANHEGVCQVVFSPNGRMLAATSIGEEGLRIWEVLSGKERVFLREPRWSVAFSPDGDRVATGTIKPTTLIWNLIGAPGVASSGKPKQIEALWADLLHDDPAIAFGALSGLVGAGNNAVKLLAARLQPIPAADPARLARLLSDLDHERFNVREQASKELEVLAEAARPALEKALAAGPEGEQLARLKALWAKLEGSPSPERMRTLRALEVLEYIGTTDAEELLKRIAKGARGALETEHAIAAVTRLQNRRALHTEGHAHV